MSALGPRTASWNGTTEEAQKLLTSVSAVLDAQGRHGDHPMDPRIVHPSAAMGIIDDDWGFRITRVSLWWCQNSYWKWWFIVDLPIDSMVIFHSYVSLPEGYCQTPGFWPCFLLPHLEVRCFPKNQRGPPAGSWQASPFAIISYLLMRRGGWRVVEPWAEPVEPCCWCLIGAKNAQTCFFFYMIDGFGFWYPMNR